MNKRHKPFDYDEKVRQYVKFWREWEAPLHQCLGEADRRASEHPSLGTHHLLTKVASVCRSLRRDLLTDFGYRVRPVKIEPVSILSIDMNPAAKGRIVNPERFPNNPKDRSKFLALYVVWLMWDQAFNFMLPTQEQLDLLSDDETFQFVRKEFDSGLLEMPGVHTSNLMLRSHVEERVDTTTVGQEAIVWLAGWVRSKIKTYPSLRLSLEELGERADDRLLQELPAATLIELEGINEEDGGMLHKLVPRVRKQFALMRQRSLSLKARAKEVGLDWPDASPRDLLSEEFLAKDELNRLIASAGLTERQRQILELVLEELRYQDIAAKLDIAEGSVGDTMSDIRKKLRKAAGQ